MPRCHLLFLGFIYLIFFCSQSLHQKADGCLRASRRRHQRIATGRLSWRSSSSPSLAAPAPRLRPLPDKHTPTLTTRAHHSRAHRLGERIFSACDAQQQLPAVAAGHTLNEHLHTSAAGARQAAYAAYTQSRQLCLHGDVFTQNKRQR